MKVTNNTTTTSPSWFKVNASAWIISTSCLVVVLAYCLQAPQPAFDWDIHVLPLAREYMGIIPTTSPSITGEHHVFQGLTVLLTGVTSGIGEALTRQFISHGATVIGTGRSISKLQRLHNSLLEMNAKDRTINADAVGRFIPIVMEMSDLESVRKGADEIKAILDGGREHDETTTSSMGNHEQKIKSLDVIICNAGMHYTKSLDSWFQNPTTPQGYDVVFVVNYMSHVLLVEKLLPIMLRQQGDQQQQEVEQDSNDSAAATTTKPYRRYPTIVHMTSSYHWGVDGRDLLSHHGHDDSKRKKMPLAATPGTASWVWRNTRAYSNSKLAQIYHSRTLKERHSLRVVNICPAWVATAIAGEKGSVINIIMGLVAFPVHGWGLASTWMGLLDYKNIATTTAVNPSSPENGYHDFYINTQMSRIPDLYFPYRFAMPAWASDTGVRSLITDAFAMLIMFLGQKFFPVATTAPSSVESYNMTIARNLDEWSMEELAGYL